MLFDLGYEGIDRDPEGNIGTSKKADKTKIFGEYDDYSFSLVESLRDYPGGSKKNNKQPKSQPIGDIGGRPFFPPTPEPILTEPARYSGEKLAPTKYFRPVDLDRIISQMPLDIKNKYRQIYSLKTVNFENWTYKKGVYTISHIREKNKLSVKGVFYSSFGFVREFNWAKTNPKKEYTDIFYFHSSGEIQFSLPREERGESFKFFPGHSIVVAPAASAYMSPYEDRPFLMRILRIPRNDRIYFDNDISDMLSAV